MKYKRIGCRVFLFWSVNDNTLLASLTLDLIARIGAHHSGRRRYRVLVVRDETQNQYPTTTVKTTCRGTGERLEVSEAKCFVVEPHPASDKWNNSLEELTSGSTKKNRMHFFAGEVGIRRPG